jgi:hypothetical protein
MEILASMASALTMVAWSVVPPPTLLWLKLMTMKVKRVEKRKTTMSEGSRRPLRHLFGA